MAGAVLLPGLLAAPLMAAGDDGNTAPVAVNYKPPLRGAPRTRVGGGTRGSDEAAVLEVLAPDHARTLSAAAPKGCVVYELTASAVRILYFQNPRFAFAILRLALLRLTGKSGGDAPVRA